MKRRIVAQEGETVSPSRVTLANDIVEAHKLLAKIENLCENPHWTTERRWKIADLARKAMRKLEGE